MTHYCVVANDRDCEVWKIKRLDDSLSRDDRVDEFGLVFEVGVRVAVAQLFGCERFELRLVLCEYRLAQRFDRLFGARRTLWAPPLAVTPRSRVGDRRINMLAGRARVAICPRMLA